MNTKDITTKYEIFSKTIQKRSAIYCDYPEEMDQKIKEYLHQSGIEKLYSHQAEMFEFALKKENIVITTSTASGKTLSFLLPVVQEILKNPSARAIFIYPTKALASDQYRAVKPFVDYFGEHRIVAGVYDGDTPLNERRKIRNSANIILTNPEMINFAFLPNHASNGFEFLFSNLHFIIIDELHTYRGAFGSHLANIFRRLSRICKYHLSNPQFFCSSATIANPIELAESICGKKFNLIEKDGSPASEKAYHLIQPPIIDGENLRKPASSVAVEILPELIIRKKNFIAFCKSRKTVEIVLKESRDYLKNTDRIGLDLSYSISGYRGGYKAEERKEIERKMISGELQGVISTNALELGIDIGKVDNAVLIGYPNTRASFWQQSGRAGRSGKLSDTYLILDNFPFDQYIAINPEWLFENKSESAVVDPNNLFIELAHLRSAAAELPLTLDDKVLFPQIGEIIPVLLKENELRHDDGKFRWCGKTFPAGDYNLRNMDKKRYQLLNDSDQSIIAELDEMQAFREIYPGAVYIHNGTFYKVISMDLEKKTSIAEVHNADYFTTVYLNEKIDVIREHKKKTLGKTCVRFGDVKDTSSISVYKKVQFHNYGNLGFGEIDPPLIKILETEGVWIDIPKNISDLFLKIIPENVGIKYDNRYYSYLDGLGFALKNAAMMKTMTTNNDISFGKIIVQDTETFDYSICLFDMYHGGLGYADKIYDIFDEIIENSIIMVSGCKCKDGCPACVGDYHLDKSIILWGLYSFLEELPSPQNVKRIPLSEKVVNDFPFSYKEIENDWNDIREYIHNKEGALSEFIFSIEEIHQNGSVLELSVENDFYKNWILQSTNKAMMINIMKNIMVLPANFDIDIVVRENKESAYRDKLKRYHSTLTE